MAVEAAILYKLMTLYMLNKVDFSLTNATIMDFFTNNGYTDYPTVLTIISNLQEDELINVSVTSSNTSYSITPKGKEMLDFFSSKISDDIKNEIDSFLRDNRYELKQTANTTADYYKTTNGDYAVHCIVKENNAPLIELTLAVPDEGLAESMCNKWKTECQNIYEYTFKTLM